MEQPTALREEWTNPDGAREARITPVLSEAEQILQGRRQHILTLDEIEEADDVLEATLFVPEWGGSVRVRQFTKGKELELRKLAQSGPGGEVDREQLEMLLIVAGVIEPEIKEEHVALLKSKSQRAVDRVLKKVVSLNAISQEEADKATATFLDGR